MLFILLTLILILSKFIILVQVLLIIYKIDIYFIDLFIFWISMFGLHLHYDNIFHMFRVAFMRSVIHWMPMFY